MKILINFLFFYFGWYIAIISHNLIAAVIVLLLAIVNSKIMRYKNREIIIIILLSILGCLSDMIFYHCSIYSFTYTKHLFILNNLWLISLWLLFLTTFNGSLRMFRNHKIYVLSFMGFFGGVLSYFFAYKLNIIFFPNVFLSLLYIGITWSIIFPCLYKAYFKMLKQK